MTVIFCEASNEDEIRNVKAIMCCLEAVWALGTESQLLQSELIGMRVDEHRMMLFVVIMGVRWVCSRRLIWICLYVWEARPKPFGIQWWSGALARELESDMSSSGWAGNAYSSSAF